MLKPKSRLPLSDSSLVKLTCKEQLKVRIDKKLGEPLQRLYDTVITEFNI